MASWCNAVVKPQLFPPPPRGQASRLAGPLPPLPGCCRHHLLTTVRTPSRLQPCLLSTKSGLRCFTSTLHGTLQPSVPPYSSAAASPSRRRATQPCTASTRRWCFGSANSVSLPIQSPHRRPLTRNSEGNGISLPCARGVVESARGPLGGERSMGCDQRLVTHRKTLQLLLQKSTKVCQLSSSKPTASTPLPALHNCLLTLTHCLQPRLYIILEYPLLH